MKKPRWYFVSVVQKIGFEYLPVAYDIDAVFASSPYDAEEIAAERNPLRARQRFAVVPATWMQRLKAVRISDKRSAEIHELREICEFKCG